MFTVDDAIKLATAAHEGQVDKIGMPYIEHPVTVSALLTMLPSFHQLSDEGKHVAVLSAVLHDVLEDTDETEVSLTEAGVPQEVVNVVKILTKNRHEDLGTYYTRVVGHTVARCVKTADLLHNNLPSRREGLTQTTSMRLGLKYGVAIPRVVSPVDEEFFYSMVKQ